MLKIALSGCNGRMGRVTTEICAEREQTIIVAGFDRNTEKRADYPVYADPFEFTGACDVLIDFSNADALSQLLKYCRKTKTPLVACTTGYSEEQVTQIEQAAQEIPILRSGNMSLGINLMMDLLRRCAQVLGDKYDVEIIEKHHNQKLDAPSGTALMLPMPSARRCRMRPIMSTTGTSAAPSAIPTKSACTPCAAAPSSASMRPSLPGGMKPSKSAMSPNPATCLPPAPWRQPVFWHRVKSPAFTTCPM